MKTIKKDELFEHLQGFLKGKGVELKEGPYSQGIHAGCSLLADAINLSQAGIERAKTGIETRLEQVRQVIHEKTAPKPPRTTPNGGGIPPQTDAKTQSAPRPATARASNRKVRRTNRKRTKTPGKSPKK